MSARLSLARIFAVCAGSASVDLIIAVGGAYFAPVLYDGDVVSGEYGSMLLVFSPLLVLVFQNYLGSASDRCSFRWGRRKPFILALTVLFLLGLTLFPFADDLTNLSDNSGVQQWIFIVTILTSTTLIDFNVLSIQVPLRAFLLDVLLPQQVVTGNLVYPMLALLGATVGFGIGSVNWSSIFGLSNSLSIQLKFVCGFSILITVALTLVALCSIKEQLDVFAPENSTVYKNYANGIKIGSLILAASSTSGFFKLLLLRPAIKHLGI